jgi:hypothetical protein
MGSCWWPTLPSAPTAMGWAMLACRPGPPERFTAFAEPDLVKIVWTLEAEPLGPTLTRFRTEARAVAAS